MTARLKRGDRLVVASHNPGKVREIAALIGPFGIEAVSAASVSLPEPQETGTSFAENALIKARASTQAAGLPALSDDSGLEVHALDGAPGIQSARWAGPTKDFAVAMEKIERALGESGRAERGANFTCALALALPDGNSYVFEGQVFGSLVWPPRGTRGFGYDPIFVPDGFVETFGEMEPEAKHAISHRARAFAKFVDAVLR
jgi:XTP/dITP diphosphohydrolase